MAQPMLQETATPKPMVLRVGVDGAYTIDGEKILRNDLTRRLSQLRGADDDEAPMMSIIPESDDVIMGDVIYALARAQSVGFDAKLSVAE
jgi:biopolymer transport protein ExbD